MNSSYVSIKKNIKRTFLPGDEWLFFKVYTDEHSSDMVLIYLYDNVVKKALRCGKVRECFFIRYQDPEYHLRLRFSLYDVSSVGEIISLMNKAATYLLRSRYINKLVIDTYERELERYGYSTIEFAERLFSAESSFVLRLLPVMADSNNEHLRWLAAVKVIDLYLSSFAYDLETKVGIMARLSAVHKRSLHFNEFNSKCFNQMYRSKYDLLNAALQDSYTDEDWSSIAETIKEYSDFIIRLELPAFCHNKKDTILKDSNVSCYIHMFINRLMDSDTKLVELVVYEFLHRYYKSLNARINIGNESQTT